LLCGFDVAIKGLKTSDQYLENMADYQRCCLRIYSYKQ